MVLFFWNKVSIATQNMSVPGYANEGISGTNTKKRDEFNQMTIDCQAGKIDWIIAKSISRFARNMLYCLNYMRELKGIGTGVTFEKEVIDTLDAKGEVLPTILSSLAQEEKIIEPWILNVFNWR